MTTSSSASGVWFARWAEVVGRGAAQGNPAANVLAGHQPVFGVLQAFRTAGHGGIGARAGKGILAERF
ncbi:MAG: hypothetical protein KGJ88_11635 [Verrucomicrobiota bacterium]|nr:hypothetical protein [Verrucomicrobiota bacterium]